jgi:HSP20 family protein
MPRTLVNLDPIAEFENMSRVMDRFLGPYREESFGSAQDVGYALPVDIYERDGKLVLRAAVPGIAPEDLDVSIENNVLTIRGETRQEWESEPETKVYHREYRYGKFTRSIRLPENLDVDNIDAEFDNGFVTIALPRLEESRTSRKVTVRKADKAGKSALEPGREDGRKKETSSAGK